MNNETWTVLVVDDNPVDREAVRRLLGRRHTLLEATTAAEGAAKVVEHEPDCVLLDQQLPDGEGIEHLPQLASAPVILLTGHGGTDLAVQAFKSGASDYLHKSSLTSETLRLAIRGAITQRRLEVRLAAVERLDAVGQLAGGVAHEFNNMLTTILGRVDLALGDLDEGHPAAVHLRTIRLAASRSAELTRRLLAFGRQLDLRPRVIDVPALVRESESLLRSALGEGIELEITAADDRELESRVDPSQLQQAVVNLALNARAAMPAGGGLRVRVERRDAVPEDEFGGAGSGLEGEFVAIAVEDDGVGMSKEQRQRAFEPFFTTQVSGAGLGLASVHGFVRQSGGHVLLTSEEGRGTTVTIFLPVAAKGEEAAEVTPPKPATGGARILVVEDEQLVRELLEEILVGEGYQVEIAESVAEAIGQGQAHPGAFDLILCDVVLKGGRGPQAVRELRPIQPQAQVIYMSGYTANPDEIADAEFLPKPVVPATLLATIRRLLELEGGRGASQG